MIKTALVNFDEWGLIDIPECHQIIYVCSSRYQYRDILIKLGRQEERKPMYINDLQSLKEQIDVIYDGDGLAPQIRSAASRSSTLHEVILKSVPADFKLDGFIQVESTRFVKDFSRHELLDGSGSYSIARPLWNGEVTPSLLVDEFENVEDVSAAFIFYTYVSSQESIPPAPLVMPSSESTRRSVCYKILFLCFVKDKDINPIGPWQKIVLPEKDVFAFFNHNDSLIKSYLKFNFTSMLDIAEEQCSELKMLKSNSIFFYEAAWIDSRIRIVGDASKFIFSMMNSPNESLMITRPGASSLQDELDAFRSSGERSRAAVDNFRKSLQVLTRKNSSTASLRSAFMIDYEFSIRHVFTSDFFIFNSEMDRLFKKAWSEKVYFPELSDDIHLSSIIDINAPVSILPGELIGGLITL